jgi:hypothetical protein
MPGATVFSAGTFVESRESGLGAESAPGAGAEVARNNHAPVQIKGTGFMPQVGVAGPFCLSAARTLCGTACE